MGRRICVRFFGEKRREAHMWVKATEELKKEVQEEHEYYLATITECLGIKK
jgi:hypothetical protein